MTDGLTEEPMESPEGLLLAALSRCDDIMTLALFIETEDGAEAFAFDFESDSTRVVGLMQLGMLSFCLKKRLNG